MEKCIFSQKITNFAKNIHNYEYQTNYFCHTFGSFSYLYDVTKQEHDGQG